MKFVKVLAAVAFAVALSASLALAADKKLEGTIKDGSCCDKAKKAGKECAHKCCVEAAKDGKVCAKCNPEKK
ncbi:MAG: hypothetical protein EBS05_19255 [Proteobacteria bacterium]|jgi:hypothetical protein|nr:hypothetical protein [Pseudomonadota bacterium]